MSFLLGKFSKVRFVRVFSSVALVGLLASVSFLSCASLRSQGKVSSPQNSFFSPPEDAPLWVRDFPSWLKAHPDYYWGRGASEGFDEASFRDAYNRALREISNYATIEFFSVLDEIARFYGGKKVSISRNKVESVFTSALIKKEQMVDIYRCPCGRLFVLVGVKKDQLKSQSQSDVMGILKSLPDEIRLRFVSEYYSGSQ